MRVFPILAGLLTLTACQQGTPQQSLPSTDRPPADMQGECIAPSLQTLVGQNRSVLASQNLPGPTRILGPNMAMTMDYRADRLNVEYDRNDIIVRIFCG